MHTGKDHVFSTGFRKLSDGLEILLPILREKLCDGGV